MTDNAENSSEARKPVLPPDNRVSLPREWPFRLLGNALILALVFLTAFLTVTVRTNLVGRQIDSLTEEFYVLTSKLGFTLDDILIEGRKKTSRRAVMEVLGLKRGDNILSLDLNELKTESKPCPGYAAPTSAAATFRIFCTSASLNAKSLPSGRYPKNFTP